ncbi:MAG: fumarylacetoacetate hydrolase family protein [Burkholderiales bacterium]
MTDARITRGFALQLAERRARIAGGEKPLGWKVGFGAPAAMKMLGIDAPLIGYLMHRALLANNACVALNGWQKPAAEAEIAVHMANDLDANADRATIQRAIAGIGPAIELADVTFAPDDVEKILAGNIYQRYVMLGACDTSRAGARLDGIRARLLRNAIEIGNTADPQAATGEIIGIVGHVATLLSLHGERLRAGEVIITGSITPPLFVAAGESLEYSLEPVGTLKVQFDRINPA